MYGLSLTASLLWYSATLRLASATLRAKSSVIPEGVAGLPGVPGVVGVSVLGRLGIEGGAVTGFFGSEAIAAAGLGIGAAILVLAPGRVTLAPLRTVLLIAAILAAISARF